MSLSSVPCIFATHNCNTIRITSHNFTMQHPFSMQFVHHWPIYKRHTEHESEQLIGDFVCISF